MISLLLQPTLCTTRDLNLKSNRLGDFSLDKSGDDGQLYIAVGTTRTTHIKSGIFYNRLKSVGKVERYEKRIGLNSDKNRFWLDDLTSLHDMKCCDSVPLNINLVGNIIAERSNIEWEG